MPGEGLALAAVPEQHDARGLRDAEHDRVDHAVDALDLLGRAARRRVHMVLPAQVDVGGAVRAEQHGAQRHPLGEGAGEAGRLGTDEKRLHHLADTVLRLQGDLERADLGAQTASGGGKIEVEAHRLALLGGRPRPSPRAPRRASGEPPPQPSSQDQRQRQPQDEARRPAAHAGPALRAGGLEAGGAPLVAGARVAGGTAAFGAAAPGGDAGAGAPAAAGPSTEAR